LKDSDVSIFRAGIWKPRTRPGGFEGVGNRFEMVEKQKKKQVANGN
jgi:chorismate mutase